MGVVLSSSYENLLKSDTPFPLLLYRLPVQSVCKSYQPAFSQICSWSQHPETSEWASLYLQSFMQKLGLIFCLQSFCFLSSTWCPWALKEALPFLYCVTLIGPMLVTFLTESPASLMDVHVFRSVISTESSKQFLKASTSRVNVWKHFSSLNKWF